MGRVKTLKRFAVGAAVAGAAGYVAGVLSAPTEGKKTRKRLKKSAGQSSSEIEKQLKQLHAELGDLMGDAKSQTKDMNDKAQKHFSGAVKNAHSTKNKLRDVLSSLHDGEASDKDLGKALEDAKRSLDHLKSFIKK